MPNRWFAAVIGVLVPPLAFVYLSRWRWVLVYSLAFVLVVFATRAFLFDLFRIPSSSMAPTLQPGGYAVMQRWGYGVYGAFGLTLYESDVERRTPPHRGELFVFRPPEMAGQLFVMRVIGLPGDHIQYENKQLVLNGEPLPTVFGNDGEQATETLNEQRYSVQYSMTAGPGRRFDHVVPDGHFFVMGDNRDNSRDSRYLGMIPAKDMIGKIVLNW